MGLERRVMPAAECTDRLDIELPEVLARIRVTADAHTVAAVDEEGRRFVVLAMTRGAALSRAELRQCQMIRAHVLVNRRMAGLAGLVLDVHEQLLVTCVATPARRLLM